jgi:hypothetical protein
MTHDTQSERQIKLLKAAARAPKKITTNLDPDEMLQRTGGIICD